MPEWIEEDRAEFLNDLDLNGDEELDHDEIYNWIVPDAVEHQTSEAMHLLQEADVDKV